MMEIRAWVPGRPVPYKRPFGKHRQMPEKDRVWRKLVADEVRPMVPEGWDLSGAFTVELTFLFEEAYFRRYAGDPDNYEKSILDALKGIAWKDDRVRQIRKVAKWFYPAIPTGDEGVSILIRTIRF